MSEEASKAVFLSYASQDAPAALRICEALRAAGVEVWFDQSELRGGDTWDHKIRKQIKECALFVPIISANTNSRPEGYFRLEWKLAVDRSHLLADDHPFLFPVVIDDTAEPTARVPEKFRDVQWTRLSVKDTPETLAVRVGRLLGGEMEAGRPRPAERGEGTASPRRARQPTWLRYAWAGVGLLFAVVYAVRPMWQAPRHAEAKPAPVAVAAPTPPAVEPQMSEARQLAAKAEELFLALDSSRDDFALAEDMLKQAVAKAPADAEVWAAYAYLHERYGARGWDPTNERRELARVAVQRALRLDPTSYEARFSAASLFTGTGEKENQEHEKELRALLQERPDDKRVLRAIASALRYLPNREDEVIRLYDRAAQLPAGDPLALYNKALALWFAGRAKEAAAALTASLAQQSFTSARLLDAYFALAVAGDLDRAKILLEQLPSATLQDDRGCYFGYLVYTYRSEPDQALAILQSFPRDWLNDSWIHGPRSLLVGNALAQAGRPDAAAVEWRAALKVVEQRLAANPDYVNLLGLRLLLLARLGETAAAQQLLPAVRQMLQARNGALEAPWYPDVCLAMGDRAEALRIIDLGLKSKRHVVYFPASDLRHNPGWAPLRGDPEFQRLLTKAERLEAADAAGTATVAPTAASVDDKSVAVLAFANLSDDKGNEYFSDGISEELLNVLAKVPGLKVTARTSSFHFKGKDTAIAEIAQQLGVAYVVEGSVRKAGDKVRITAQLIKAAGGFHVWSDTFTRDLKDVFAVQDEIAGLIANQLSLKMGVRSGPPVASVNPESFELYVQARQAWNLRTLEGIDQAEDLLNRALAIEPNFARAHAALASVWSSRDTMKGTLGAFNQRNSAEVSRIQASINRALALEPNLDEAYVAQGILDGATWKTADAQQSLRRAIELNPGDATAHQILGRAMIADGRLDEAVAEMKRAAELDPLSHRILDNYAIALRLVGRPAEALVMDERALALQPSSRQAMIWRALDLSALGRHAEALEQVRRLPADTGYGHFIAQVFMAAGQRAEAEAAMARPGTERAYSLAVVGRWDEALKELEATNLTTFNAGIVCVSPLFDPLRSDPRFLRALERMGLSEAHARAQAWRAARPVAQAKVTQ